jgi:hypothetical protein
MAALTSPQGHFEVKASFTIRRIDWKPVEKNRNEEG